MLIELTDIKNTPDPIHQYEGINPQAAIIVDNGSYCSRVGWNSSTSPLLTFRNVVSKARKDRRKDKIESNATIPLYQVGNDIENLETVRAQLKTQFERNVVCQFQTQEEIFDYTFEHLGITSLENNVPHPILMTEALATPNACRTQMTELLFETYGIPALGYGIDALFSYYHQENKLKNQDALIISFGYHTVHVIPILNGKMELGRTRRLNLGGYHIITYLYRLMQMKYPVHINALTVSRMETLLQRYGSFANDYQAEVKNWAKMEFYDKNVRKIQLPYTIPVSSNTLSAEQKQERRVELAKRLTEINARRAREKLAEERENLKKLHQLRSHFNPDRLEYFEKLLKARDIKNLEELNVMINETQNQIEKLKKRCNPTPKNLQLQPKEAAQPQKQSNLTPPPNLTIEEWTTKINAKRVDILNKKQMRKQRRQALSKRHTPAAQERMRIISQLAKNEKANDDFGMNDDDWNIYKTISRDDSESELENEQLVECESILRRYDPNFEEPTMMPSQNFTAEQHQLHFGLEAIRCPEIIFQPSMIGNPECGLIELIDFVLKLFEPAEQQRLCDNIFLTGGCAQFNGLKERIEREIAQIRPFQSTFNISIAKSPELDSWFGAKDYSNTEKFHENLTTQQDYAEKGAEYYREHELSNKFFQPVKQV